MTTLDTLKAEMQKALAAEQAAIVALQKSPRFQVIDCVNESTVLSDADCAKYVAAVQTQVTRDFFPLWGIGAKLNFIPSGGKPSTDSWWMIIADTSDQANALGYHFISNVGQPLGYVFAKSDLDSGASVSVTLAHEVLEMLCLDPKTRVLTADLRWVPIETLSVGQELVGFEEFPQATKRNWKRSNVEHLQYVTRPCYELIFEDGTRVVASEDHKWLARNGTTAHWVETKTLKPLFYTKESRGPKSDDDLSKTSSAIRTRKYRRNKEAKEGERKCVSRVYKPVSVWSEPSSYEAGYIAAALEGEGTISGPKQRFARLSFSQADNVMLERFRRFLSGMGIRYTTHIAKRQNPNYKDCHTTYISRKWEAMFVLGHTRPLRLLNQFKPERMGSMWNMNGMAVRLKTKRYLGHQQVVAMQTSERTFLAEGLASHNCDPQINLTAQLDQTRFVAFENCDPVEKDSDGYEIDGVQVSDFVLPSYFSPGNPPPYDFRKLLSEGMPALRPDGYLSIYVIGQGWTQIDAATNAKMKMKAMPHVGSRRQRRAVPRKDWVKSEAAITSEQSPASNG